MAKPIWKDYYVTLGTADSVDFRITCDGEVIYVGRSHRRPSEDVNRVRINDIVADYLESLRYDANISFTPAAFPVFGVQTPLEGEWDTITEESFINDWSYDYDYNPATMGMSFPINGHISPNQWIVYTAYEATTIDVEITLNDGTTRYRTIQAAISADFNTDFNSDFALVSGGGRTGTAVFRFDEFDDVKSISIDGRVYEVVGCSRYALFYQNAYGGWDSFLIEGNHLQEDSLTRHIREVVYDNRNISNRGRVNYVNEIGKSFTFHTSWLNDEQSSRMHHLLNATNVFLYDSEEDAMIPVILENAGTQHKTYKNNGAKLVNYEIKVTIAQERMRR